MPKIILFLLVILSIVGCQPDPEPETTNNLTEERINTLVYNAARGDSKVNDSLSGIIDYNYPVNENYSNLTIRKVWNSFFVVLLEHENPLYNVFAVYDTTLALFLLDRSATGKLTLDLLEGNNNRFLILKEEFISKDTLLLEKLSLYKTEDSQAALVYRGYSRLITPANHFKQQIVEISDARIKTEITSEKRSPVHGKGDIFSWQREEQKYNSNENLFNRFVEEQVKNFKNPLSGPQIADEKSALESVGIFDELDTLSNASNTKTGYNYSLTLDENWKDRKINVIEHIKETRKGVRHFNSNLGASISVIKLDPREQVENLTPHPLPNVMEGTYRVRYSDKIESNNNYVIYFEYSCGDEKFLMIFTAPVYTYPEHLETYNNIFNSFLIDC